MTRDTEKVLRDFLQRETASLPESVGSPYERVSARFRERRRSRMVRLSAAAAAIAVMASGATIAMRHAGSRPASTVAESVAFAPTLGPPSASPSVLHKPITHAVALIDTGTISGHRSLNDPILVTATGAYRTVPLRQITTDTVTTYRLSPDGTRLAIGIDTKPAGTIAIVAIDTGHIARYQLRGDAPLGEVVSSIAWAPDGGRLAYLASITTAVTTNGTPEGGQQDAGILDLSTGSITVLSAAPISWFADGQRLLVSDNFTVGVSDISGKSSRLLDLGSLLGVDVGKAPVAPNGQAIALVAREGDLNDASASPHQYTLVLRDTGGVTASPAPAAVSLGELTGQPEVIGWAGNGTVVIAEPSARGPIEVKAVDVETGGARLITLVASPPATGLQLPAETLARLALAPTPGGAS